MTHSICTISMDLSLYATDEKKTIVAKLVKLLPNVTRELGARGRLEEWVSFSRLSQKRTSIWTNNNNPALGLENGLGRNRPQAII